LDSIAPPLRSFWSGQLLCEGLDASSATFRVGYHDAAYFNREYKSVFGLPPMRDMDRLRETSRESASLGAV
jgi:AraC-like DNA-binding protein